MSKIIESLRGDLALLQEAGAIGKVTMRKWEQGETRPTGPALKLLNLIADKGLRAII